MMVVNALTAVIVSVLLATLLATVVFVSYKVDED